MGRPRKEEALIPDKHGSYKEQKMTELEKVQQALYASRLVVRKKEEEADSLAVDNSRLKDEKKRLEKEVKHLKDLQGKSKLYARCKEYDREVAELRRQLEEAQRSVPEVSAVETALHKEPQDTNSDLQDEIALLMPYKWESEVNVLTSRLTRLEKAKARNNQMITLTMDELREARKHYGEACRAAREVQERRHNV